MTAETDNRPSIAELQHKEAEATRAPWAWSDRDDSITCNDERCASGIVAMGEPTGEGNHRICINEQDRESIIALRNAAAVLLEIVAAALAMREQERVAARIRFECLRMRNPPDAAYNAIDVEDGKLKRCTDAFATALAKVRP